jgi:hypothetical protein
MRWKSPRETWHNKDCAGNHRVKSGTTKKALEITA